MATIESLHTSITQMKPADLTALFLRIRESRRRRPAPKVKAAKANAQSKRTTKRKKAPSQQDIFSMLNGMSEAEKVKIAQQLIKSK